MQNEIDLAKYISGRITALVGRTDGEELLSKLKADGYDLEKMENDFSEIRVVIPHKVVSLNKSFFLGLFETSVQRLGRDGFLSKYCFLTTEHIKVKIRNHVDAALLSASQKEILDV